MSSEIKVDTISEKTSANGVVIDGVTVKDGAIASSFISGLTSGLSSAQQFRLTANVTSTGDLTANWEVPDTENQGNMGSLVSESSGIFTFSSTGYYFVRFDVDHALATASNTFGYIEIYLTNDNSTYTASSVGWFGGSSDYDLGFGGISTIIDVTNTTNDKVKFKFTEDTGTARINGSSTVNKSYVTFMKLGET
tara:strand:- start:299 stop:880 length:582 start_codon:yes stop_codon:yes gene_type:complete